MVDVTYRALLIGNSSFPDDPHNLQELAGPLNDVAAMKGVLTDPEAGLFEAEGVRLVAERTVHEVRVELERFFSSARARDTLLLYYSGHGLLDQRNQLYLCARDTRTDLLKSTAVGAAEVSVLFEESAARTTVIVLDCCHSGAFKGGGLADSLRGTGRYLLTSARRAELAADAVTANLTSAFTHHLVEGLRAGATDSDGDGFADLGDLYEYVYGRLGEEGRQIPQRSFSGDGVVPMARRAPRHTAPVPVASEREAEGKPALALSTAAVDLGVVEAGDDLEPEQVFVRNDGGGRLDWLATTEADWVEIEPHADFFTLCFRPTAGRHEARVVVRDRAGGTTRIVTLAVEVRVPAKSSVPGPSVPGPVDPGPGPGPGPGPVDPGPVDPGPVDPDPVDPGPVDPDPLPSWVRPALAVVAGAVVLVAAVLLLAPGGGGGGGGVESRRVVVPGDQAFTDTGLALGRGDEVAVAATGTVLHDEKDPSRRAGPDGDPGVGDSPANLVAGQDHSGLIGRVGPGGEPFLVGSRWSSSGLDGELFLGINDRGVENNGGSFTAQVEVRRG